MNKNVIIKLIMDRKKSRQKRNTRVIITNTFMAVTVVAIVAILMLFAMGYSFNLSNGRIDQSGLVEISSRPNGATVAIDGKVKFERTRISSMLSSGKHNIKISKSGYDVWQRDIDIEPGLLTNIDWIRLFPVQPELSDTVNFKELRLVSFSKDRRYLITVQKNKNELQYINLLDDKLQPKKIKLSTILGTSKDEVLEGNLSVISWNQTANKIILTWQHGEDIFDYYLVDLQNPEASINLTQNFNLSFDKISFANDAATKLWAVEAGNLHSIDSTNLAISATLARNVESFTSDHDVVALVNTDDKDGRGIRIYRDGETGSTLIRSLEPEADKDHPAEESDDKHVASISLAMGTFWNDNWLAYSVDGRVRVLSGTYPSFAKPNDSQMTEEIKFELAFIPKIISVSDSNRIIILSDGENVTSIDIETRKHYNYKLDAPIKSVNWLDSYLFWQQVDNKIIVRDFDGANRREIITDANNQLGITLTQDNNYLYRFDYRESKPAPVDCATAEGSTTVPSEAECSAEAPSSQSQYVLIREKLKV